MQYFERFSSNTIAGGGNQYFFSGDPEKIQKGRIFYRIEYGGTFAYSMLWSNIMDSTFSNGAVSHKNLICETWKLLAAKVGRCRILPELNYEEGKAVPESDMRLCCEKVLTFNGRKEKDVMPGEFFNSDPVEMTLECGDFLCIEIEFQGRMIPNHQESVIASMVFEDGEWRLSKNVPFPGMVGCDRKVNKKICYLGDSITQGCGTGYNAYEQWNAPLSASLDQDNAYWNLGLGFGRADDAASDGAWLYKAKQNDAVVVCFGVNDIFQGFSEEQIRKNLKEIVVKLQTAGCRVLVQTIPPFDYPETVRDTWIRLNRYILEELSVIADAVFDVVPVLCADNEHPWKAGFGGHPDAVGCQKWAEALRPVMQAFISKI